MLVIFLALGFLPLTYSGRKTRWRYALQILYFALGVVLFFSRPFTPCLPANHVGTLASRAGEQGRTVILTGVIDGWPDVRPYRTFYRLRAERLITHEGLVSLQGDLLLQAPRYPAFSYGDRVTIVGTLRRPPVFDTFDYRRYLARKGVHAILRAERVIPLDAGHGAPFWSMMYRLRASAGHIIDSTLPEPYAALSNGILLGIESGIPRTLYGDFNATGTSHIIVISGFNIAIIAGLLLALLVPFLGQRWAGLLAIGGIGLYVLFVGADAAVVRAGLMGMIYAGSRVVRRQGHVLNSLAASAFLMLLLNPLTLWDLGFQLSFLATLGLIIIHPVLESPLHRFLSQILPETWRDHLLDILNEALIVTLAAQLTTTPLIIAAFGRVSLVSLLTNALILPVQPLIMIGAGLSTLAGAVWLPLGRLLALMPLLPLAWTVAVVRETARWPGAGMQTPPWLGPLVAFYYMGLAVYVALFYQRLVTSEKKVHIPRLGKLWGRVRHLGLASTVLMIGAWVFMATGGSFSPPPRVTLFPGGSLRFEAPRRPPLLLPGRQAFRLKDKSTVSDLWILTEMQPEALASLRLRLQKHPPRLVIYPLACQARPTCEETLGLFLHILDTRTVPRAGLAPGQSLSLGLGLKIDYLPHGGPYTYPLRLQEGRIVLLLPADIPPQTQSALDVELPPGGIWPLPLPGGGSWPRPDFLTALAPTLLLYPDGVTYPPASRSALKGYPLHHYDPSIPLSFSLNEERGLSFSARLPFLQR